VISVISASQLYSRAATGILFLWLPENGYQAGLLTAARMAD
jgi:hypothetical protein